MSLFDDEVQKLAALPPLEYEGKRKSVAKELGIRLGELDKAVKDAHKGTGNTESLFPEVSPWPDPVKPSQLLTEISSTIRRFIICDKEVADALALWASMSWFVDEIHVAPIALVTAPEKRCGKSLLLSILAKLVRKPLPTSNITPAALFRTIEGFHPTLLIDEADTFLKGNEQLRGIIDSGHTRDSAFVIRVVEENNNFIPKRFTTWACKAIAGIGRVSDTIADRAIIVNLRRKMRNEKVERLRDAEPRLFERLQSKLARFAADYRGKVGQARPPLPDSLNDRAQDNWEPLLAIAMIAGAGWLETATKAAVKLSGSGFESQSIGTELLTDIKGVFDVKQTDRISTAELIEEFCRDEEKRWATYDHGSRITPRQLAGMLKDYGIKSKTVRIGYETPKGYVLEQFDDVFSRYLALPADENIRHTPQPASTVDLTVAEEKSQTATCATSATLAVAEDPPRCGFDTERETRESAPIQDCGVVSANEQVLK